MNPRHAPDTVGLRWMSNNNNQASRYGKNSMVVYAPGKTKQKDKLIFMKWEKKGTYLPRAFVRLAIWPPFTSIQAEILAYRTLVKCKRSEKCSPKDWSTWIHGQTRTKNNKNKAREPCGHHLLVSKQRC